MSDADRDPRRVSRRGRGGRQAGRHHRRGPRARRRCWRTRSPRPARRWSLVARTERDLKAVAEALPGPSLVLSGDVTDEDFNEAVADATVAEWGGLDVWICNAGHLAGRGRAARDRRRRSGGGSSRST